jgi:2-phospho-L-lactate guanylyltransferase (CobY/MobA/RfbA family)
MNKAYDLQTPFHQLLDVIIPTDAKIAYADGTHLNAVRFQAQKENGEHIAVFMHSFGLHTDLGEYVRHLETAQKNHTVVALQGMRAGTSGLYVLTKEPQFKSESFLRQSA